MTNSQSNIIHTDDITDQENNPLLNCDKSEREVEQSNSLDSGMLNLLSQIGVPLSKLNLDVAVSADTVENISNKADEDVQKFQAFADQMSFMLDTNAEITSELQSARTISEEANDEISSSHDSIITSMNDIKSLVAAVEAMEQRMAKLSSAVESVGNITAVINGIAKQTNLLALNATIEAARAGEAGKGFSVVASEVKSLASSTTNATTQIEETLGEIKSGFEELNSHSKETTQSAQSVEEQAGTFSSVLENVSNAIQSIDTMTSSISTKMDEVNDTCQSFVEVVGSVSNGLEESSKKLINVSNTMRLVADSSDDLVLLLVKSGGNKDEASIFGKASDAARTVAELFEQAMTSGALSEQQIFSRDHQLIEGTKPPQYMATFTPFCDDHVSPLIEEITASDERIAWCAAEDDSAYIPCNVLAVSKPQGDDEIWNIANCRNRRYFKDRTGAKVAKNRDPFLLQTYQRDMGGGKLVPMKDIACPIFVNNRFWGNFRVGYRP